MSKNIFLFIDLEVEWLCCSIFQFRQESASK